MGGTRERVYDVAMWAIPAGIVGAEPIMCSLPTRAAISARRQVATRWPF